MRLMDYHTHSSCSPDGENTITELAFAAVRAGLTELAVTDHYDIGGDESWSGYYDVTKYRAQLQDAREQLNAAHAADKLTLVSGVELGQGAHDPAKAQSLLDAYPYDFVIGSLHNLRGMKDFYFLPYENEAACYGLIQRYLDELLEIARMGRFDVLGHLTYPLRYMAGKHRLQVDFRPYEDRLRSLFTLLAQSGKGVEVNTSGLRGTLKKAMPDLWCLKLYRACGGEIVTVGSDAHTAGEVGVHVKDSYRLLQEAGFAHVCAFRQRKPDMIKISP